MISKIPAELVKHYSREDDTDTIMAIPECLLNEAKKDGTLSDYECPVPLEYILEKGYKVYNDFIVCDVQYSHELGLMIDDEYYR